MQSSAVLICSYSSANSMLLQGRGGITSVVSICDPGLDPPEGVVRHAGPKLCLQFRDLDEEAQLGAPSREQIAQILEFGSIADGVIMFHCAAGISRSSGSAFAVLCARNPPGREEQLLRSLHARFTGIFPNRLIVQHADTLLGRNGRMVAARDIVFPRIATQG